MTNPDARVQNRLWTASILPLVWAVPFSSPALAQQMQGADSQGEATTPDSGTGLDDIIVTARKRSENLRDVPIAVTAITGAALQAKNIVQIIDLPAATPNFQFSYGAQAPFIFIRGFGSGANAAFEQSVGKFIDNVSYGRDQDGRIPIFDVERVEVLKGPQVLAFGNSATVGALNVTTRKPGSLFEADGSAIYEFNRNEVQIQGGITVPLAGWASMRLAGLFQDLSKGDIYNPLRAAHETNRRNWAIRPTLDLDLAPGLRVSIHGEYDRLRDDGNSVQAIAQPLRPGALQYPDVTDKVRRRVNYNRAPVFSDDLAAMNAQLYQADVTYDLAGGTLSSTTAYRKTRSVQQFGAEGPNDALNYFNSIAQRYSQFSQEIRFSGSFGSLDVNAGGYYQKDTLHIDALQYFLLAGYGFTGAAATPFGRVALYDQKTRNNSAFVDLTYRITDGLSVSGGIRYSDLKKTAGQDIFATSIVPDIGFHTDRDDLAQARAPALAPLMRAVVGTTAHTFPYGSLQLKESHWQPQVIVQYKPTSDHMIYAKYVSGDKVGGFDFLYAGTDPSRARFGAESAEAFELGAKGRTLDGRLDYSIALFRTTFTALQQSVLSNLSFIVSNVGKARSQGVEVNVDLKPLEGLKIGLGGSYLDAKFLSFPGAACNSGQNLATPSGCVQDLSGTRTQYASKYTGIVSLDYQHPVAGGDYIVGGGTSVIARSRYNAGAYNDPRMEQPGFAQVDAHLDLRQSDGPFSISLFARNLTDRRVLDYAVLAPAQSTAIFGSYGRGRQIGLRLAFATR